MKGVITYFKNSYQEFATQVEWPKWGDLQKATVIVGIATLVMSLLVYGVDNLFSTVIENVFKIIG